MLDQHPTSTLPIVGELLSAGVANLGSGAECAANEVEPDTFTAGWSSVMNDMLTTFLECFHLGCCLILLRYFVRWLVGPVSVDLLLATT